MILRILRANHFYNFLLIPIVGFLLLLGSIIQGGQFPASNCELTSPLCHPLLNSGIPFWGAILINFATVIIICFLLLQINAKFSFVKERTFLPAFIFLFVIYALPELRIIQPVFFAAIFLILAIQSIFNSFEKRSAISHAFNAGFLLGLSGVFYLEATYLILLVPTSLYILRNKVQWREMVVPFVGLLLPWFFVFSYYFLSNNTEMFVQLITNSLIKKEKIFLNLLPYQIFIIYLMFLISASSIFILRQYGLKNISVRRYFKILFLFFISTVLLIFLPSTSSEILVFLTIPLTFLVTNYLVFVRRRIWAEIFLLLLILFSISIQFFI